MTADELLTHVPADLVRQIHAVVFDPCRNATDVVRAVNGLAEHGRANQAADAVRHRGKRRRRWRAAGAPLALAPADMAAGCYVDSKASWLPSASIVISGMAR
jgi:hypothetical protein